MKAAVLTQFGKTDDVFEIKDFPQPTINADEVLINVKAVAINPVDVQTRNGETRMLIGTKPPTVIGVDAAGVVAEVGSNVTRFKAGDEVFVYTGLANMNTFAEYCVAPEKDIALKPESLSFEEAAAMPLVAMTAWQGLLKGGVKAGDKVFVQAGTGGVGGMAIQMAKYLGAHVATSGNAKHADLLRELGADEVIDYKTQNFWEVLSDYDVALDLLGGDNLTHSFDILKAGGKVVSVTVPDVTEVRKQGVKINFVFAQLFKLMGRGARSRAKATQTALKPMAAAPNGEHLSEIAQLVDAGTIRPVIDQVFPLEQIAAAFTRSLEKGKTGKTVVKIY